MSSTAWIVPDWANRWTRPPAPRVRGRRRPGGRYHDLPGPRSRLAMRKTIF